VNSLLLMLMIVMVMLVSACVALDQNANRIS
jgi:hypothetical protein